jgi:hypothetical protein
MDLLVMSPPCTLLFHTKLLSLSAKRPDIVMKETWTKLVGNFLTTDLCAVRSRAILDAAALKSKLKTRGEQLLAHFRIHATCMESRDNQPAAAQPFLYQQQVLPVADGHHPGAAAAVPAGAAGCFTRVIVTVFFVLTLNSGMAVHHSHGDRETIAFVALAYLDLVALLLRLRGYENAEPGSQLRYRLKIVVWLLTTALTLLFSLKVAAPCCRRGCVPLRLRRSTTLVIYIYNLKNILYSLPHTLYFIISQLSTLFVL